MNKSEYKSCPWLVAGFSYSCGLLGLHEEIEQFYNYIQPTSAEIAIRNKVIQRMEQMVLSIWPDAVVETFGSFRTGLLLPGSDIDLVVSGVSDPAALRKMETQVIARNMAAENSLRVIEEATTPIIRLTDRQLNVKIDMSFTAGTEIQFAELIKKYMQEFPQLARLVLVLKQYIHQCNLIRDVPSFKVALMCISFLQLRQSHADTDNLGILLLEFFELYGREFNYMKAGISLKNGGCYIPKANLIADRKQRMLCIEDPIEPHKLIGVISPNGLEQVKYAFVLAHRTLSQIVMANKPCGQSILGTIIRISDEVIEYREWIRNTFECAPDVQENTNSNNS